MNIVFFDLRITGHHSEYIEYLADYISESHSMGHNYYFIVHPNFMANFPEIAQKVSLKPFLKINEVTLEEFDSANSRGVIRNSISEYKIANRYAKKLKADHVVFLYLNTLQLALVFYRPSYTVSGILFLQFFRMTMNGLKDKIKYVRKYLMTKFYVLNPKIKTVFILNDDQSVNYFNKVYHTSIFKTLPDPIPELQPLKHFDVYKEYGIEIERKIYLHIGALADRKGTIEVIDSVEYIPDNESTRIAILLVGKANSHGLASKIRDKIELNKLLSEVVVIWVNEFVSKEKMKALFEQCYAVLMPYKNSEASSGILGHAIASNKMVITTNCGLLKELVEENDLGLLINEITPLEISKAIVHSLDFTYNTQKSAMLKTLCDPSNFSDSIITSLHNRVAVK